MLAISNAYSRVLDKRPLMTKMGTTFIINGLGDTLCQFYTHKQLADGTKFQWDSARSLRQAVVGATLQTPYIHFYLTRAVPHLVVTTASKATDKALTFSLRLFLHNLCVIPYSQAAFFMGVGTLKFGSLYLGFQFCKDNVVDGIKMAYCVWPLVQSMIYTSLIPIKYANLFMDACSIPWAFMLSYLANRKRSDAAQ
jgi:hypothetical protein